MQCILNCKHIQRILIKSTHDVSHEYTFLLNCTLKDIYKWLNAISHQFSDIKKIWFTQYILYFSTILSPVALDLYFIA